MAGIDRRAASPQYINRFIVTCISCTVYGRLESGCVLAIEQYLHAMKEKADNEGSSKYGQATRAPNFEALLRNYRMQPDLG